MKKRVLVLPLPSENTGVELDHFPEIHSIEKVLEQSPGEKFTFPICQTRQVDQRAPGGVEVVIVLHRGAATVVDNIPHFAHRVAFLERVETEEEHFRLIEWSDFSSHVPFVDHIRFLKEVTPPIHCVNVRHRWIPIHSSRTHNEEGLHIWSDDYRHHVLRGIIMGLQDKHPEPDVRKEDIRQVIQLRIQLQRESHFQSWTLHVQLVRTVVDLSLPEL